jgi:glutathione S-transferase
MGNSDDNLVQSAKKSLSLSLEILNNHFEKNKYVCGEEFSAADIAIGYCIQWTELFKDLKLIIDLKNVKQYLELIKKRSSFQLAYHSDEDIFNNMLKENNLI